MKPSSFVLGFAALVLPLALMGAGCSSSSTSSSPSATDTTSVTTPVSSDSSSSSAAMNTAPTNLAFPGVLPAVQANKKVRIKTTLGDIVIQVDPDQGPNAASNFVYLVQHHFYDGTIFHRVIPGFMIQGGDPTGTGTGGPGYQFADDPVKSSYKDGIVAMANAGPNTNGSQFFIMVADYPLGPNYSIFGHVIQGLDVAHAIANVPRNQDDRPNQDVKMTSVTIEP